MRVNVWRVAWLLHPDKEITVLLKQGIRALHTEQTARIVRYRVNSVVPRVDRLRLIARPRLCPCPLIDRIISANLV
jgi:hypothetical protein